MVAYMSVKNIVIFGGSMNPPGTHHVRIAERLASLFDEVIVVPCGPRSDKLATNDIDPLHRAAMCDLAFGSLSNVKVDLFDLEQGAFTRTRDLERKYSADGAAVWHLVGTDLVQGGAGGRSIIQGEWADGPRIWRELKYVVCPRDGYIAAPEDLPPRHRLLGSVESGSSTEIRRRVFGRDDYGHLVPGSVRGYIERYGLYRGRAPLRSSSLEIDAPAALLVVDERREKALDIAKKLEGLRAVEREPNCVVVAGGDGTMLHAIREHWHRRLPFIGVNAGTVGFLLNGEEHAFDGERLARQWNIELTPLLYVEIERADGSRAAALAFNDAYARSADGQAVWLEVSVDGVTRIPKLVSDGALVASPAGTTAHARAMGAPPLPLASPALTLVGSNVFEPYGWKCAHLTLDSSVELRSLGGEKRRIQAFVDGVNYGEAVRLSVRASRIAGAELAFSPKRDMAAKIAGVQFPATVE